MSNQQEEVWKSLWVARYVVAGVLCAGGAPLEMSTRAQHAKELAELRSTFEAGVDYISPSDQVNIHRLLRGVH